VLPLVDLQSDTSSESCTECRDTDERENDVPVVSIDVTIISNVRLVLAHDNCNGERRQAVAHICRRERVVVEHQRVGLLDNIVGVNLQFIGKELSELVANTNVNRSYVVNEKRVLRVGRGNLWNLVAACMITGKI